MQTKETKNMIVENDKIEELSAVELEYVGGAGTTEQGGCDGQIDERKWVR